MPTFSTSGTPALRRSPTSGIAGTPPACNGYAFSTPRPNHSLKRRANGVPPGPRGRAGYHRPRGPAVTPSSPA
jgi:hypothetical protein